MQEQSLLEFEPGPPIPFSAPITAYAQCENIYDKISSLSIYKNLTL